MKSILVDALRQANGEDTGDDTEVQLDDSARLQKTSIEEASNDCRDAGPQADELELLEHDASPSAAEPSLTETREIDVADIAQVDAADALDATPAEANDPSLAWTGMLAPGKSPAPGLQAHQPRAASRPATFERYAAWTPAACLLAACLAAAVFSGWNRLAGPGGNADLRALSEIRNAAGTAAGSRADGMRGSRFAFAETAASGRSPSPAVPRASTRTAGAGRVSAAANAVPAVQTQRNPPRLPANTAAVDTASFSSAAAAYAAYRAGDIGRYDVEKILQSMARSGGEQIALDLKLLLQRYPESALLNHALGTALAEALKWPEAKLAFERAEQLSRNAAGGRMQ